MLAITCVFATALGTVTHSDSVGHSNVGITSLHLRLAVEDDGTLRDLFGFALSPGWCVGLWLPTLGVAKELLLLPLRFNPVLPQEVLHPFQDCGITKTTVTLLERWVAYVP